MQPLNRFFLILLFLFPVMVFGGAEESDDHIRSIVKQLLQEKDEKIAKLEAKIQQLESRLDSVPALTPPPVTEKLEVRNNRMSLVSPPKSDSPKVEANEKEKQLVTAYDKLSSEVKELQAKAHEAGLNISGFFDYSAHTDNQAEQTFDLGTVEVDLEYLHNEHFAANSALVWDGDTADIGVGVIDYHSFDDRIPPRGRIFGGQGFHIQAGRFDLPFSSDYQYFASRDRPTYSAPITTERIQRGGFNSDGLRYYGAWENLNYAAFWTNSVYENNGMTVGGRLGLAFGRDSFSPHLRDNPPVLEIGLSYLSDLDRQERLRRSVYAGDFSFNYDIFSLRSEVAWLDTHRDLIDGNLINYGRNNELAYHVTLLTKLESLIHYPVTAYARFDNWNHDSPVVIDSGDNTIVYAAEDITRLTVGFNFALNDFFQFKFEYADTLGS